jgi:hypothetical protein
VSSILTSGTSAEHRNARKLLVRCWYGRGPNVGMADASLYKSECLSQTSLAAARRPLRSFESYRIWAVFNCGFFPNGSKLWRLAYRFYGKQKLIALGRYPEVSLLDARIGREKARALLKEGRDPSAVRQLERIEAASTGDSFNVVANEYVAKLRREGPQRCDHDQSRMAPGLRTADARLALCTRYSSFEVLAVLRKVEARGRYDTARRLRATIGAVCRYAAATARAEIDPQRRLVKARSRHLPSSRERPSRTARRSARSFALSTASPARSPPAPRSSSWRSCFRVLASCAQRVGPNSI